MTLQKADKISIKGKLHFTAFMLHANLIEVTDGLFSTIMCNVGRGEGNLVRVPPR